jgi:hypothetical protein
VPRCPRDLAMFCLIGEDALPRQPRKRLYNSLSYLVPMAWIEHATSPLPRECSTTELHGRRGRGAEPAIGADEAQAFVRWRQSLSRTHAKRLDLRMSDDQTKPSAGAEKDTENPRAARLATALRRNLARRKAQGRARRQEGDGPPIDSGVGGRETT